MAEVEKVSHISIRNEIKWSKTNLFAYLSSNKSPMGVTMTGNNNVYKTTWKNGNKDYNQKYICWFFRIWNLKSTITYKCGRVVLSCTLVFFAIRKVIPLFSCSFHATCIISFFCHQKSDTIIFMFFSCNMHYTFQHLFLHWVFHVSLSF